MANKITVLLFSVIAVSAVTGAFANGAAPTPPPAPSQQVDQFQEWLRRNNDTQKLRNQVPSNLPGSPGVIHRTVRISRTGKPGAATPLTYEEYQQQIVKVIPKPDVTPNPETEAAFNVMLQQNIPLSPEQIVKLRQQIDSSQRAASFHPSIPPKPVSSTLMVNLAPGATPPAIRLAQGYVSSLVFVDSTGAPWPIASFDIGNPKAVNMQWDGKSNVMLIQAVTPYSDGNMVVRLLGMPTPITLQLVAGQRVVDYRVDIHVSGLGPNSKDLPTGSGLPESANQLLLGVLDGVAPPGSHVLSVRGADAQAWVLGTSIYFRTRLTVLSPGWVSKMSSPDGMLAYELPKTSSVLVSRYGEPVELKIEGF
ncbi:MAG: hypothetical protein A3F14_06530 [Gammaproteobacteria bacterium RIFCSPHIGHO2_12_FULL_43_28]|nr:MAG: hypothetical protein A3F14_06530 [Gammaproteobacteria bacterium RIFCSPHIGHO2_12_FULL_43_28]